MDVKTCIVQNPFDKHGKQVHDALFKQKWLKQFSAGQSHYIVVLFLVLQTLQALDKSGDRVLGQTFIWWNIVQLLICYVPVFGSAWLKDAVYHILLADRPDEETWAQGNAAYFWHTLVYRQIKRGNTGVSFGMQSNALMLVWKGLCKTEVQLYV